jgi:hypothetical protein
MTIKIEVKEILKYLDEDLLYEAFQELANKADEDRLNKMRNYIYSCFAFNSTPKKKK